MKINVQTLKREEFIFLQEEVFCEFTFLSGKDKHFELWLECQTDKGAAKMIFLLEFVGPRQPLKVGKRLYNGEMLGEENEQRVIV